MDNTTKTPYIVIGQRINTLLAETNTTQKDLAELLGVKPNIISYYCGGYRQPSLTQLSSIADHFDTTIDYLIGRTNVKTQNREIKMICEYTGLSEKVIENLKILNERNRATWEMNVTNDILSSKEFMELIFYATHALTEGDHEIEYGLFKTTKKVIGKTQIVSIFQTILDKISEKYESISDHRFMYAIAYDWYDKGTLTKEQLEQVIKEYDQGNFDFDPRNDSK